MPKDRTLSCTDIFKPRLSSFVSFFFVSLHKASLAEQLSPMIGTTSKEDNTHVGIWKDPLLAKKLEMEQNLSKLNRHEVECQWRKILRLEKLEGLRNEVKVLAERNKQELDQKERIIKLLHEGFNHSEDQFRTSVGAHLQSIDSLIDLHDHQLLGMEENFKRRLHSFHREYDPERELIIRQHEYEKQKILDRIVAMESEELRRKAEDRCNTQQMIEEIKNRNLEEINGLRFALDTKIEDLEEQFDALHGEYLQKNDHRSGDCESLTAKDTDMQKEIDQAQRKIEQLQCSMRRVKAASRQNSMKRNENNRQLLGRKNKIMEKYQFTKGKFSQFRDAQHKKLAELTKCANSSRSVLETKYELAERILKLAAAGKRLENDRNNTASHIDSTTEAETGQHTASEARKEKRGRKLSYCSGLMDELDVFWEKYNKILLDTLGIEKEADSLQERNESLKVSVKGRFLNFTGANNEIKVCSCTFYFCAILCRKSL